MIRSLLLFALALLFVAPGCRTRNIENPAVYGSKNSTTLEARANLAAKSGSSVGGEVTFRQLITAHTQADDTFSEVLTYARVEGLAPGAYTLRLHDASHCDAPAANAEAGPNDRGLEAGDDGEAKLAAALTRVSLEEGDERRIVGKSVVVHEGTAAVGTPLACGVIEAVEAKVDKKK